MANPKPTSFRLRYEVRLALNKLAKTADRSRAWVVESLIMREAKSKGLLDR